MKPKAPSEHEDGLLEYLEDIIGTSHYKERIDAALVEVERCAEDRADKLARLKIVEKEKAKLEEGKREAEDYIRTQNEWVRARSRLVQWQSWQVGKLRQSVAATVVCILHHTATRPNAPYRRRRGVSSKRRRSATATM